MNKRIAGSALGTALLTVFLVRGSAPGPTAGREPQSGQATSLLYQTKGAQTGSANTISEDGPWKASRDYFAERESSPCSLAELSPGPQTTEAKTAMQSVAAASPGGPRLREKTWCIPHDATVQAMIAIVPDPLQTHMALTFDRSIEAIQLAAGSENYVMDRYWLPWDLDGSRNWIDYGSQVRWDEDHAEREKQPGLLLFRNNPSCGKDSYTNKCPDVLYVFVVGETSTTGINGTQFRRATEYWQEICKARINGCVKADHIRIMGPTFSGSLASLRQLTEQRNRLQSLSFRIYSGTVSSREAIENQQFPKDVFSPLMTDTNENVKRLLKVLEKNKDIDVSCEDPNARSAPEVALFVEAGTTFGGAVAKKTAKKVAKKKGEKKGEEEKEKDGDGDGCTTIFEYPREISSLRNAYPAMPGGLDSGDKNATAAPRYLPFSLIDQQTNSSDEPPSFSARQSPLSKEAVLIGYAAALRRDGYKYAGIFGSNVLDVLFLTAFLRNACPDIRLFVENGDLLFEHDIDNTPYIGVLSLNTYPQFGRYWEWAAPTSQRPYLPISDQIEDGQYQATQKIIREMFDRQPEAQPDSPRPLWLTAVGNGGYWPVERLLQPGTQQTFSPRLRAADFNSSWKALFALLCALAGIQIFILLRASPTWPAFRDFSVFGPMPAQAIFFIYVICAALALGIGILAAPAQIFGSDAGAFVSWVRRLGLAPAISLFAACILLQVNYSLRRSYAQQNSGQSNIGDTVPYPANSTRRDVVVASVAGIGAWLTAILVYWNWRSLLEMNPDSSSGFFFAYRAIHLDSGVSPLMPVIPLLASICFWAVFELRRLRFHESVRPRLEDLEAENKIADSVSRYIPNPAMVAGFFLIFGTWLLFLDVGHPFHIFENYQFGLMYEILFCMVVATMLASALRLWRIWTSLKTLLRDLERTPLRGAFLRMKGFGFSWSPVWQPGGQEARWTNMVRSFEAIRNIANWTKRLAGQTGENPAKEIAETERILEKLRAEARLLYQLNFGRHFLRAIWLYRSLARRNQLGEKESVLYVTSAVQRDFAALQIGLSRTLQATLERLREYWRTRCADSFEDEELEESEGKAIVHRQEKKVDEEKAQIRRLEQFAALRYVEFIRGTLDHIRFLIIYVSLSFTLALISLNVYSFEPHHSLTISLTALFGLLGFLIVGVMMQTHRDPILSHITGTKPNELGLDFYIRIFTLGVAPLLTILATHFPAIGRFLTSFLQPGVNALK
jgi:hypothetical protein